MYSTTAHLPKLQGRPFPKEEIRIVLEFLGSEMGEGRVGVESFDGVVNGLIEACHGDFRCELVEFKRKMKVVLVQFESAGR